MKSLSSNEFISSEEGLASINQSYEQAK
jgi:hypothetical protein